jgi:sugar transferase EpsL
LIFRDLIKIPEECILSSLFVAFESLLLSCLKDTILSVVIDFIITKQFPVIMQERSVTLKGKPVRILKIRTITDSKDLRDKVKNSRGILFHGNLKNSVPLFCRWLRKSGIDEVLQLLNVIKGEMALVGPRPLLLSELKILKREYHSLYRRREKINSLPGITGYWQVNGKREKGIDNLIELDEYYEKNRSLFLNMKIVAKTIIVMLTAAHSDAIIGNEVTNVEKFLGVLVQPIV